MSVRVLFLDIDGVLNSARYIDAVNLPCFDPRNIDENAVLRLNRLFTCTTDVKIVISSTWRFAYSVAAIRDMLNLRGLSGHVEFVGATPEVASLGYFTRGSEISLFLTAHPSITSYAIVDDDPRAGAGHAPHHFVCTNFNEGLLDEHVDRLIEILSS